MNLRYSRRIVVSLLIPMIFPLPARSQGPTAPPEASAEFPRDYKNSSDGLRWQLQDMLNAARGPNRSSLESLIRQTEIPSSNEWFPNVFERESGETWAGAYKAYLGEAERNFEDVLTQLADQDGEFFTRIVNDGPASARKIEAAMIKALQHPADIYFVSWKQRGAPPDSKSTAIGYFYLEGTFRLDSAVSSMELQPEPGSDDAVAQIAGGPNNPSARGMDEGVYRAGVGGAGYPTCVRCPDPNYTKSARKRKLEGMVVLQVTIQADGKVTDIQLVKSPDQELAESAIEAVRQWQMNPAHRADGEPVPVRVPIEVTFRLLR